ncbi:hypothetical protein OSTOST_08002 [Ostertagia ostertagi]
MHRAGDVLSSRGLSVLYSTTNGTQVLAITLAIKITKYYHLPTQEYEITFRQTETQTERTETRTVQTQVHRRHSTTASNTELHLLSVSELEDTVAAVVSKYLQHPVPPAQPEPMPIAKPSRPAPDEAKEAGKRLNGTLGKNLVPRLQKLRVLDRMIGERTALVERFDADFVKQEIARKRTFILKCRMAKEGKKPPKKAELPELAPPKLPSKATREVATHNEESEESEEADESTATSTEEESTSESSTSSSRETVLENKFFNGAWGEAINRERRHCRMAKEGKVLPKKAEPPKPKLPSKATREAATQFEKAEVSSESSTTSETASESSEESEESEEADESTATSTEEESASESSTSSSRETVLRINSSTAQGEKPSTEKDDMVQEIAEEPPKALSPTSLYLKQLREKILKERMEKI